MTARKPSLSPPFAHRELNGELLVAELRQLRAAQVPVGELHRLATALGRISGLSVAEAAASVRQLQRELLGPHSPLSALLRDHAGKLRAEGDPAALAGHFSRLANAAAALEGMRRASAALAAAPGVAR